MTADMTPDWLLLRRYAQEDSQEAFAALTARYLSLVYSVCLREVHDPDLAQDVTQAVFLLLARTAPAFRSKTALPGWLFRTARFAAQNARTRQQRRRHYEEKAALMVQQQNEGVGDAAWTEIEPVLNSALAALREGERDCVLLRFFQGLSFAEAGAALGLSEEAARKRVTRALEKMQRFFGKEGIVVPSVGLAALLSTHAMKAAPATCSASVATITAGALTGQTSLSLAGSQTYNVLQGVSLLMKFSQTKAVVAVAVAILLGVFTTYAVRRSIAPKVERVAEMQAQAIPAHWGGRDIRRPMRTLDQIQNYLTVHVYQVDQQINSRFNRGEITEQQRQERIQLASQIFASARDKTVASNYTIPFDDQTVSRDLQQVVGVGTAPDR